MENYKDLIPDLDTIYELISKNERERKILKGLLRLVFNDIHESQKYEELKRMRKDFQAQFNNQNPAN